MNVSRLLPLYRQLCEIKHNLGQQQQATTQFCMSIIRNLSSCFLHPITTHDRIEFRRTAGSTDQYTANCMFFGVSQWLTHGRAESRAARAHCSHSMHSMRRCRPVEEFNHSISSDQALAMERRLCSCLWMQRSIESADRHRCIKESKTSTTIHIWCKYTK